MNATVSTLAVSTGAMAWKKASVPFMPNAYTTGSRLWEKKE